MKKKQAIKQLTDQLKYNDECALRRATEEAGEAATVTLVAKDYEALAKDMLEHATVNLAYERASQVVGTRAKNAQPILAAPLPAAPMAPPTHCCQLRDGSTFWYTPTGKANVTGRNIQEFIHSGWAEKELRDNGYIV